MVKQNMTFFVDNFMHRVCNTHGDKTRENVENFSRKITSEFRCKDKVKTMPFRPKLMYAYLQFFFNLGARMWWVVNTVLGPSDRGKET
jgi:hypothetical protein